MGDIIFFIAHRGLNNHKYKANSINALLKSLQEDYISGVELDIRVTKDNKLIIFHNLTIISLLKGINYVGLTNFKKLKKIDNSIELLEDFLNKVTSMKIILIEIKEESPDYKKAVDSLLKLLKKYKLNIYIFSFNYEVMNYLREQKLKYPLGLLTNKIFNKNGCVDFDFCAFHYNYIEKDKKNIMVYTVNNVELYKEVKKNNHIKYIITDKAYLLKDV